MGYRANALSRLINDGTGRISMTSSMFTGVTGYDEHASFGGTKKPQTLLEVSHSIVASTRLHLPCRVKATGLAPEWIIAGGKERSDRSQVREKWSHVNEIVLSLILLNLY